MGVISEVSFVFCTGTDGHFIYTPQGLNVMTARASDEGYCRVQGELEADGETCVQTIQVMVDGSLFTIWLSLLRFGEAKRSFASIVYCFTLRAVPPSIVRGPFFKPPYTNAVERFDVYLKCIADGKPTPQIRWFRVRSTCCS